MWNDVYLPNTKDIMTIKSNIPGLYSKLVEGINYFSTSYKFKLLERFNYQTLKLRRQDGSLDISALNNFLNDGVYHSLFNDVHETYQKRQNCITQMMNIGINMSKEMSAAVKVFRGDSILGELNLFEETLSQTLLTNTEDMLIDKFEYNELCLRN